MNDRKADVLYVSYWGLLEPLGRALVLPAVRGMARRGLAFTLITFDKARDLQDRETARRLASELQAEGVRWVSLRYHKWPTIPATLFDIAHGLVRAFSAGGGAIVHGRAFVGGVIGWLAARLSGRPFVYHNEGFWPDQQVEGGFWSADSLVYRATRRIDRFLHEHADGLILLSERSRPVVAGLRRVRQRRPPTIVVPSCVDLDAFRPPKRSRTGALRLVYVGSLGGRYRIAPLYHMLTAVRAQGVDASLRIVSQSNPEMIREALGRAGAPPDEIPVERVPHQEVPGRLAEADAGLFFLATGVGAESCSPTKVGEYWASGLPVVANAGIGDVDAIIAERRVGVVLEHEDEEGFRRAAKALIALLHDPDLPARCHAAALACYDLSAGVIRQIGLYRDVRGSEDHRGTQRPPFRK